MNEKAFYTAVLSYGGPRVHELVAGMFLGPSLGVSRKHRSTYMQYEYGLVEAQVAHVKRRLVEYGIPYAPCLIGEDGSAIVRRLDTILRDGKVLVYGLCGGAHELTSKTVEAVQGELDEKVRANGHATTLYAWVLIPVVKGAPHIPLLIACHDNSKRWFDTDKVVEAWKWFWMQCKKQGIQLFGHTYDGDRRCFKAGLEHMCGEQRVPHHAEDICFSSTPLLKDFRAPFIEVRQCPRPIAFRDPEIPNWGACLVNPMYFR